MEPLVSKRESEQSAEAERRTIRREVEDVEQKIGHMDFLDRGGERVEHGSRSVEEGPEQLVDRRG